MMLTEVKKRQKISASKWQWLTQGQNITGRQGHCQIGCHRTKIITINHLACDRHTGQQHRTLTDNKWSRINHANHYASYFLSLYTVKSCCSNATRDYLVAVQTGYNQSLNDESHFIPWPVDQCKHIWRIQSNVKKIPLSYITQTHYKDRALWSEVPLSLISNHFGSYLSHNYSSIIKTKFYDLLCCCSLCEMQSCSCMPCYKFSSKF